MARMHSRKKGKSGSSRPLSTKKHIWLTHTKPELEKIILKIAKTENKAAKIGIILRDSYGVPNAKQILDRSISSFLKENKLYAEIPEDLLHLLKKEQALRIHLEKNKQDMPSKRGLQLTESKIRRLVKYYKRNKLLAQDWTYTPDQIKFMLA